MNNAIAAPVIPPTVGTIQNAFVNAPAMNNEVISIGMIVPPTTGFAGTSISKVAMSVSSVRKDRP